MGVPIFSVSLQLNSNDIGTEIMLNEIFMTIPDHRVTGRCTYALSDLLTIALLTYICGGEDYVDMSEFAYYRAREFGLLGNCPDSSPPLILLSG